MEHRVVLAVAIGFLTLLVCEPRAAHGAGILNASEVITTLGALNESNRSNAIAIMARSGQVRSPLSGSDGAAILQGTTQASRTASIGELGALFKTDLSGQEAEAILGSEATLSGSNRSNAIAALARAKRFGPSLSEDAAQALKGTTEASRAAAIGEMAPYLRADLPGLAIATILGRSGELTEGNRSNAIAALARAGKLRACLSGDDMNLIMLGVTGQSRVSAIAEIANSAKPQCVTAVFSETAISSSIAASTAGSTPALPSSVKPTLPQNTGSTTRNLVITATAHGKSSDHELVFYYPAGLENTEYRTKVAVNISVSDSTRPWHFQCFVNDTLSAESNSTTISVELMPQVERTYSIRCNAKIGGVFANSTPAYVSSEALHSNIVTVQIINDHYKYCRARLGKGCYGSWEGKLGANNPTTVQYEGCPANKICLRSGITVASVRHDRCCSRTKQGLMCSTKDDIVAKLLSDGPILDALTERRPCTRCFIQAACDTNQVVSEIHPLNLVTTLARACEPYGYNTTGTVTTDPDQPSERCESDAISNATNWKAVLSASHKTAYYKAFPGLPMMIGELTYDVTKKNSTPFDPDLSPKVIQER